MLSLIWVIGVKNAMAQQIDVSGRVTDISGEPLPGVSIVVKGTIQGVITDIDGNYILNGLPDDATLVYSFVGMKTQSVLVTGQTVINIMMEVDAVGLEEVVAVGYGSLKKRNVTGSISSIKTDELPISAATSIENVLQGRAPGLNLSLRSAQPGGASNVNIRGSISPRGNNSPLYVIDGVPITNNRSPEPGIMDGDLGYSGGVDRNPLNTINPSDIESVDILKDASATAIYGSAAANGVILITTKKGKAGDVVVDYRGSYTHQRPKDYLPYLNAKEFMSQHNRMAKERYLFDNKIGPYGNTDPSSVNPFVPRFTDSEIDEAGVGTDWLGMLIRDGHIHEHNVSLTGGTEKTRYYASVGYYDNKAILENSDFKRYTGRINLDQKIGKKIDFGVKITFSQVNSNNASTGANDGGSEKFNMLQAAYSFAPNIDIYEEDGSFSRTYNGLITNPAAFLVMNDKLRTGRFFVTPKIDFKISSELKLTAVGSLDRNTSSRKFYLPTIVENAQLPEGMAQLNTNRIDNYTAESFLTYNKTFENSSLTVVAGAGFYKTINDGFGLQAVGFFTDAFEYNNVGVASERLKNIQNSYRGERTKVSQFMRLNYSLYDKYIFSFVGRRDGSSIFAANKKYGFFPGASVAWRIKEEKFMQNLDFVTDFKVRAGYGTSGNESILSGNSYQLYKSGFTFGIGETVYNGVTLGQVENKNLTWETNITTNVGLDFSLFDNRISGSLDLYRKTAKDLLDYNKLPSNNAVGRVAANVGSTRSDGFEIALNTENIKNSDFQWTTNFTLSKFKAYWVERNPEVALPEFVDEKGGLRDIYGWETDGIIRNESEKPSYMADAFVGNIKYVDKNNDGILDKKDVVKLGNWDPELTFGFGNSFVYKNFDLNIYLYGVINKTATYGFWPRSGAISGGSPENSLNTIKDVWTSDNPTGTLPGIASNPYSGFNPTGTNDFKMIKMSFARVKNISLGYQLPINKLFNGSLSKAKVFVDFQNIGLITNYEGFDPEYSGTNPYPQAFSTTVGVNLTF